ncbi:hypothetical protein LLW17_07030 [Leeuwenhoekiella sp. Mr9]|uniref:Uncharacterized protein n=1 Tax=Leeuwenhoekiella parthenopeia TaxID=2890320 RepID=A0ABS8GR45_9FLAO|nr:hypothetical protein [Leeuwenhoekiella parthenopeia]
MKRKALFMPALTPLTVVMIILPKKEYPYHRWYTQNATFRKLSDHGYNFIAKHRPAMFKLTKMMFGSDPLNFRPYWLMYILGIIGLFFVVFQ